jgi:hypothetical protein
MTFFVFLAIPTRARIIPANLSHLVSLRALAKCSPALDADRQEPIPHAHFQQNSLTAIQICEEEVRPNLTLRLTTPRKSALRLECCALPAGWGPRMPVDACAFSGTYSLLRNDARKRSWYFVRRSEPQYRRGAPCSRSDCGSTISPRLIRYIRQHRASAEHCVRGCGRFNG